jgi:hypothetical protein
MGVQIIKLVREMMFPFTFVEGKHTVMNMEHSLERNVVFKSTEEVIGREM